MNNQPESRAEIQRLYEDRIDNYKDTVFAILGFMNLFTYDVKRINPDLDIMVFQGRRMLTSENNTVTKNDIVTPDICVQLSPQSGIIGEVKHSFPSREEFWLDDFKQLMRYDDDLQHWVTNNKRIQEHSIVLLTHIFFCPKVKSFLVEKTAEHLISFSRELAIIEYGRVSQRQECFLFRIQHGQIPHKELNQMLVSGHSIPMDILMIKYEKTKLSDDPPPMPYLMQIMWEVILEKAADRKNFESIRKNSKIPVETSVEEMVEHLYDIYSFKSLNSNNDSYQPKVPVTDWVRRAFEILVEAKIAEWKDKSAGTCKVYFKKYEDTLEIFIEKCIQQKIDFSEIAGQTKLF